MSRFQQHASKIITVGGIFSIFLLVGLAVLVSQAAAQRKEIASLQGGLKEKAQQLVKMQEALGSETSARASCESAAQPMRDELAAMTDKLSAFALQASACEQIRLKLKK